MRTIFKLTALNCSNEQSEQHPRYDKGKCLLLPHLKSLLCSNFEFPIISNFSSLTEESNEKRWNILQEYQRNTSAHLLRFKTGFSRLS